MICLIGVRGGHAASFKYLGTVMCGGSCPLSGTNVPWRIVKQKIIIILIDTISRDGAIAPVRIPDFS